MTFSYVLSHQFVKSFEVLFAQVLPELLIICRYEIVIDQSASCDFDGHLSVLLTIKLLNLLYLVLQLTRHLINLSALHVLMIYLISSAGDGSSFASSFLHLFELEELSFSEFNDHEFLKLNKIDDVKKRFESV